MDAIIDIFIHHVKCVEVHNGFIPLNKHPIDPLRQDSDVIFFGDTVDRVSGAKI